MHLLNLHCLSSNTTVGDGQTDVNERMGWVKELKKNIKLKDTGTKMGEYREVSENQKACSSDRKTECV